MSKQIWRPGTLEAPIPPAMVSCGTLERPNVLTIAWTGIVNTIPPMTYISVRPQRHSYQLIKESGEFVINLTTRDLVRAADYCGVKSGAQVDKFAEMHLTPEPASQVAAPLIAESPINLECRVKEVLPLGSHHMFLADIVAVQVDERYLDETGKLHMERCKLAAFAHGTYYALGEQLGNFGYSVKKKKGRRPGGRKEKK